MWCFLYYFLIKKAKIPLHLSVFWKFEGDITKTNAPQGGCGGEGGGGVGEYFLMG